MAANDPDFSVMTHHRPRIITARQNLHHLTVPFRFGPDRRWRQNAFRAHCLMAPVAVTSWKP